MKFKHTANDSDEVVSVLTNFMINSYGLKKISKIVWSTGIQVKYNESTHDYDIEAEIIFNDNDHE